MKRFTITGKKVFRDNQEGVFYVLLNDDTTMIQVGNNPEDLSCLAWNQSSPEYREEFLKREFPNIPVFDVPNCTWIMLPKAIQDKVIAYQKSKMEIKA